MRTEDLIASLAGDVRPLPRHVLGRRILVGLCAGAVASLLLIGATIGFRPDLASATRGADFWIKLAYTVWIGCVALYAVMGLARPDQDSPWLLWPLALPVLLIACVALVEMAYSAVPAWPRLWMGQSWRSCPWLVLAFSGPMLIGLFWAFRRLAPTRLRLAGAASGLAAGAWAAALYCLHCPESSALFVLTWYSLGIAAAAAAGALAGPKFLRW